MKNYLSFTPITFLFLLLCSISTSPLFVYEGMDSVIFKTIGLAMAQGKMLYVDIFDHKGPILFFIQALGQWLIPGKWGIFLIQILADALTFTFLYRTIGLFLQGRAQMGVMAVLGVLIASVLYDGNQCEEWMLPATSIACYYTFRYLLSNREGKDAILLGALLGVCFTINCYIRANDAVAFVGAPMLGLFLELISRKKYQEAIYASLAFGAGMVLVSLPVVAYFAYHHALPDFYYGWLGFNLLYTGVNHSTTPIVIYLVRLGTLSVLIGASVLLYRSAYRRLLWAYIPMALLGTLLLGERLYLHYFLNFSVLLLPLLAVLSLRREWRIAIGSAIATYVLVLIALVSYAMACPQSNVKQWIAYDFRLPMIADRQQQARRFYDACDQVMQAVPQQDKDSVWNYNLEWRHRVQHWHLGAFIHHGMVPCNRVILYEHYAVDSALRAQQDIRIHRPKWIVLSHENDDEFYPMKQVDYDYIDQHYRLIQQADTTICNLMLYQRIEEDL